MNQTLIANTLSLTLFVVALFISLRAFYLYRKARSRRLFILGLSMGIISLTAAAGFLGDNVTSVSLNVDWFNYIGQTCSFLFILLSLFSNSDEYLRQLMRWHIVISLLLLFLFFLAPVLPPEFPDPAITKTLLSGSRGLICLVIFYSYIMSFMAKETRFSLLMGVAFLLLSAGYFVIIPKYSIPNLDLLDELGDLTRVGGLITLFVTILIG
ncbi:MAG TPA: hypothetical protein VKU38_09975 [Ktedonobacteraceae bacterium]|nr:hypothetical protein [Ktedonobacteraceae bacterium]